MSTTKTTVTAVEHSGDNNVALVLRGVSLDKIKKALKAGRRLFVFTKPCSCIHRRYTWQRGEESFERCGACGRRVE